MANVETRKEKGIKRETRELTDSERFSEFVRKIMAVPKSEIQKNRKKHK